MQRRTFLQSLLGAIAAPLLPKHAQQDRPPTAPAYTDSDNNDPATLVSLHDGQTTAGGVTYGA